MNRSKKELEDRAKSKNKKSKPWVVLSKSAKTGRDTRKKHETMKPNEQWYKRRKKTHFLTAGSVLRNRKRSNERWCKVTWRSPSATFFLLVDKRMHYIMSSSFVSSSLVCLHQATMLRFFFFLLALSFVWGQESMPLPFTRQLQYEEPLMSGYPLFLYNLLFLS